jgi:hypothetical protein
MTSTLVTHTEPINGLSQILQFRAGYTVFAADTFVSYIHLRTNLSPEEYIAKRFDKYYTYTKFILTNMTGFCDVEPCRLVEIYRRFMGDFCLHLLLEN